MSARTPQRASAALQLQLAGHTYREIAQRLGYADPSGAYRAVVRGLGDHADLRYIIRPRPSPVHGRAWRCGNYLRMRAYGHPLAGDQGYVSVHRAVAYDSWGEGPHACMRCGVVLGWDRLVVHHIDNDGLNNDVSNLAPACRACNVSIGWLQRRGLEPTDDEYVASVLVEEWRRGNYDVEIEDIAA